MDGLKAEFQSDVRRLMWSALSESQQKRAATVHDIEQMSWIPEYRALGS